MEEVEITQRAGISTAGCEGEVERMQSAGISTAACEGEVVRMQSAGISTAACKGYTLFFAGTFMRRANTFCLLFIIFRNRFRPFFYPAV